MENVKKWNKAHEVLMAIGIGYLCGVWQKSKRYHGPTRSKTEKDSGAAKSVGVAVVLRDYFSRKNLDAIKRRKVGLWKPYSAR